MKNISARIRTIYLPHAKHLSSPLRHQLMSFSTLFFILSECFLRGQDEKQFSLDLSHRHTSYEPIVFQTISSAQASQGYVFLF